VTVIVVEGVAPSPDLIDAIAIGSFAKAPTISNSGLCGAKPISLVGYLSASKIFRVDDTL